MSAVRNLPFGWEQTLLSTPFTTLMEPVLVPVSPWYAMVLPPMVMRVRLGSALVGRTLQTTREWATSWMRSCGILWNMIGCMVSVPSTRLCCGVVGGDDVDSGAGRLGVDGFGPMPWHKRPSSFA